MVSSETGGSTFLEETCNILIKGGTVVTAEGESKQDVLIIGETIAEVGNDIDAPAGCRVIDAGGCFVMPGGIDPHTHMEASIHGYRCI